MKRILARSAAALILLCFAFSAGASYNDFRSVRDVATFGQALRLLPLRLRTAVITPANAEQDSYTPYQMYSDVLTTLKENYYGKEIDPTEMTYNGIRGMMGSLNDRYTRFMDPKDFKQMMDETQGEFAGIGAELGTNAQEQIYVVRVLRNSPALRAKLMAGDIILKVDDTSTLKMKDTQVVKLIRGEPDTKVVLTLQRKGVARPIIKPITRGVVQQEVVVSTMLDPTNKIGYILLSGFNEESDIQLGKAMSELQRQGMRGLIFDMRENPGGLVNIAREIASRFISTGPIVWTKSRNGEVKSYNVIPSQHSNLRFPLVVLVNGGSASAAEIVSAAIQDTKSGVLIGEKTFGKGVMQTIEPLADGSGVAITTEHYYTPRMHDINHKGIEPDISVKYTDADTRKMYSFMRLHPEAICDLKYDTQLQRAVAVLHDRMKVASARPW